MTVRDFTLPDLGEGLTESEIVSWRVAVGDPVELNQIIAEVETAKALVELPSPFAGVVAKLYEEPGATVQVGSPIVAFEVDDAADASLPESSTPPEAPASPEPGPTPPVTDDGAFPSAVRAVGSEGPEPTTERNSVLVGYGPKVEGGAKAKRKPRKENTLPEPGPTPPVTDDGAFPSAVRAVGSEGREPTDQAPSRTSGSELISGNELRPKSTPPVRKLAADLGVDLSTVTGTGAAGVITREDVQAAASSASSASASVADQLVSADRPRETRTPIKGVRKHTAAAMVQSAFTAPHVTEFLTVDVTPTVELIETLKSSKAFAGKRLTMLAIVAKAMCIAVERTPSVNSRWDEAAGEIVEFGYVNLGIAVATPRGLMVPNIHDAQKMQLPELVDALTQLGETARSGETTPAALSGGTISITNVGVFGVDAGTPILNPGEAAILAMGAVRERPWEHKGEIALRDVMTLSLSFDHRLVDGEQGSRFLTDIGSILAEPGTVLTMV